MRIVNYHQKTPEWRAWRASRRMASETPALMGASQYIKTQAELWRAKVLGEERETSDFVARAREHGNSLELAALQAVALELDLALTPLLVEDDAGQYGASLDGAQFDLGEDHVNALVEIKCPASGERSTRLRLARDGVVRGDDLWQMQHQIMVSGAKVAYYAVYMPDGELHVVRVNPDLDMQQALRVAWDAFWTHVEAGVPPGDAAVSRQDDEWLAAVAAYREAKALYSRASGALRKSEELLHKLAGESSVDGGGLKFTRYWARGSVDYSSIPALTNIELDLYRKPGGWRSRITLNKTETKS